MFCSPVMGGRNPFRRPAEQSMAALSTMLLAISLVSGVAGQDPNKKPIFFYPPDGSKHVYNKMDTVMVSYECFYEQADLWTFCEPGRGRMIYRQVAPGFKATVPVLLNFTSDTPCWFNVRTGENGVDGTNSAAFNLLGEVRSPGPMVHSLGAGSSEPSTTTSSSSTSTSTTTPTTSTPTPLTTSTSSLATTSDAPDATPTETDTDTDNDNDRDSDKVGDNGNHTGDGSGGSGDNDNDNDNAPDPDGPSTNVSSSETESGQAPAQGGLSAGTSAGIGVGAAAGVIALAGGLYMLWRWRRGRGRAQRAATAMEDDGARSPEHIQKWPYAHSYPRAGELSAAEPPVEIQNPASFVGPDAWRRHHEMSA